MTDEWNGGKGYSVSYNKHCSFGGKQSSAQILDYDLEVGQEKLCQTSLNMKPINHYLSGNEMDLLKYYRTIEYIPNVNMWA